MATAYAAHMVLVGFWRETVVCQDGGTEGVLEGVLSVAFAWG